MTSHCANINNISIESSTCEKLLGIKIDGKLKFDKHVESLCNTASQKVNALARIASYMNFSQRKLIMNSFITSQFGYCPLVWMFHSRSLNHRINRIHERSLRIIYKDYKSSFQKLLERDNSVTIHQRNLQSLAIEIFKAKNNLAPEIVKDIFLWVDNPYNLRNKTQLRSRNAKTITYGTETLAFIGPKIWGLVPIECKNATCLSDFKQNITKWIPKNCPCRLCKTYIEGVGFI